MRIGVDVGGTNTDAVVLDGPGVLAHVKSLTTADISSGIIASVTEALEKADVAAEAVRAVMLGTTQFTNSVVERRNLAKTGILRIGAQSSRAVPPFAEWPGDIRGQTEGAVRLIDGGHEYDGEEIVPLDDAALEEAIADFKEATLDAIGIISVFSPVNPSGEVTVAERVHNSIPGAHIALSHEIGRLGIYQRENATILNAALMRFADKVVANFEAAFAKIAPRARLYLSQNDGTLMNTDFARRYPVLTFSSGPTNSMRGAAYLSGVKDAMVIDVGGTTSDIGMLMGGFPRESSIAAHVGGVLTNFRMPDVLAIGLGGGTIIRDNGRRIGPDSVGHELPEKALVFGGDTLTATDIGVAAGLIDLGDRARVAALNTNTVKAALSAMKEMLARGVDKMKTERGDMPVIAVGGGAFLVPEDLAGASDVMRPELAGVANAIGAGLAQVSGEAELLYVRDERDRKDAFTEAKATAEEKAIAAGAAPETLEITEIDEIPMSYIARATVQLRVKVVGELRIEPKGKPA